MLRSLRLWVSLQRRTIKETFTSNSPLFLISLFSVFPFNVYHLHEGYKYQGLYCWINKEHFSVINMRFCCNKYCCIGIRLEDHITQDACKKLISSQVFLMHKNSNKKLDWCDIMFIQNGLKVFEGSNVSRITHQMDKKKTWLKVV